MYPFMYQNLQSSLSKLSLRSRESHHSRKHQANVASPPQKKKKKRKDCPNIIKTFIIPS